MSLRVRGHLSPVLTYYYMIRPIRESAPAGGISRLKNDPSVACSETTASPIFLLAHGVQSLAMWEHLQVLNDRAR